MDGLFLHDARLVASRTVIRLFNEAFEREAKNFSTFQLTAS
jgi:hypothetical protein